MQYWLINEGTLNKTSIYFFIPDCVPINLYCSELFRGSADAGYILNIANTDFKYVITVLQYKTLNLNLTRLRIQNANPQYTL